MRFWALLVLLLLGSAPGVGAQTYLVVVHGIGGETKFRDRFATLSAAVIESAAGRYRIPEERIRYLAESESIPGAAARSTKANIESTFAELGEIAEADAKLFVVLIGHGSATSGSPTFQIPGPDITAQEFATLLIPFSSQEIVFIVLASASGGFIPELSGPRRTIVTATKSGFERNETYFPLHFVAALSGDGADTDRDDRLSVSEAFEYARREVERFYVQENQLQTEHALLDDNGDGEGSGELGEEALDGLTAQTIFFSDQTAIIADADDPELARLLKDRQRLEGELAALRARKAEFEPEAYADELERLLLEIARVGRAIRERGGSES